MNTVIHGSIVIPAHNEARTLGGCLSGLADGLASGRYEAVVVSNGSCDATADVARHALASAQNATVVELAIASKISALRRGDEVARSFPRVYLDADVTVDEPTVDALLAFLAQRLDPVVAAPSLAVRTESCSWVVRAYYRVWLLLPYVRDGVIGVGIYAVNRAAKEQMGPFPNVVNDDEWVRQNFTAEQRAITPGHFYIQAARSFLALVRQRTRVEIGNVELHTSGSPAQRSTSLADLRSLLADRSVAPSDAGVYVMVVIATRLLAKWRRLRGTSRSWSTDATSRQ